MALPPIFPPAGTPQFITEGHSITPSSIYDDVGMLVGHGRKRRIYTTAPRVVGVTWFLTNAQMAAVDDWFENTLQVGNEKFTAEVGKLGGPRAVEYWAAQWVEPYQAEPYPGASWLVTGSLLLTGQPSDTKPDTGELALEIEIGLTGTVQVTQPAALALEIEIGLGSISGLVLEIQIGLDYVVPPSSFLLREGSGFVLREDGSKFIRE